MVVGEPVTTITAAMEGMSNVEAATATATATAKMGTASTVTATEMHAAAAMATATEMHAASTVTTAAAAMAAAVYLRGRAFRDLPSHTGRARIDQRHRLRGLVGGGRHHEERGSREPQTDQDTPGQDTPRIENPDHA
jgi:hypothetical protein